VGGVVRAVLPRLAFVAGILLAGALPLLARAVGPDRDDRCRYDGLRIPARSAVRVAYEAGGGPAEERYCCIRCADRRLAGRGGAFREAFVTDDDTGREIPAATAAYARSLVVANPATGDRTHAFSSPEAARRHVGAYGGVLLEGAERPKIARPPPTSEPSR
jgi:hypothetical protein